MEGATNKTSKSDSTGKRRYKKVLKKKRFELLERLNNVQEVIDGLLSHEVIDDTTHRDIRDTINNKTRSEGIRKLIDDVLTMSERNYDVFLQVLGEIKSDELKEELQEAEDALSDIDLADELGELNLEDNAMPEIHPHYDICILYEDPDCEIASKIKSSLEALDQSTGEDKVKILLHDDSSAFQSASVTDKLTNIAAFSTIQFYIVPKSNGNEDTNLNWTRDSLILKDLHKHKLTVYKVITDENNENNNSVVLANLQLIKWFDYGKDFFAKKMKSLINSLKKTRPGRSQ